MFAALLVVIADIVNWFAFVSVRKLLFSICVACFCLAADANYPRRSIGMVRSQQNVEIRSIDENVFRVYGQSANGSGVVVLLPDTKLAVLTAAHVVAGMGDNESIEIQLSEDVFEEIPFSDLILVPGYDIAIVPLDRSRFERTPFNITPVAISKKKLEYGSSVFVSGFPVDDHQSLASGKPRVTYGAIQAYGTTQLKNAGYTIGYSSDTFIGMSGGGVFSSDGKLIAIHGRGEAIDSSNVNKTGTNFGIGIDEILSYYRSKFMKKRAGSTASLVDASRAALDGDYKKSHDIWRSYASKYPDSFIAQYNADCLGYRAGLSSFQSDNYPEIYNSPRVENPKVAMSRNGSFLNVYLSDPLVREYWVGGFPSKVEYSFNADYQQTLNKMSGKPVSHLDSELIGKLHSNLGVFALDIQRNGMMGYTSKDICTPFLLHGADLVKMWSFGLGYGNPFLPEPIVSGESMNFGAIEIRP